MVDILQLILSRVRKCASAVWRKLAPFAEAPPTLVDAIRSRRELLVENALLRHQIVMLRRQAPRPRLTPADRLRLLLAACLLPGDERHRRADPGDGRQQSSLGSRAHPRRVAQDRRPREQANDPEVHAVLQTQAGRPDMVHIHQESRPGHLVLRFHPELRPPLPPGLPLLRRPPGLPPRRPVLAEYPVCAVASRQKMKLSPTR